MTRTTNRIRLFSLAAALSSCTVLLGQVAFGQANPTPAAATPQVTSNPYSVKADPSEIDFGDIPTMDNKTAPLHLVNTDNKPHTVNAVKPSCGCTTTKFVADTVIPAGGSIDVQITLSGGSLPGPIQHKIVTVVVDGQPDMVVQLKATAVSFVVVEPSVLDPEVNKDGKFKLRSTDGQAFRIMSIMPQVIDGFPDESKAVHELTLNWDRYNESAVNRRITFFLDHPKCQQTFASVNIPNKPGTEPKPEPTESMLEKFVKEGKTAEVMEQVKKGADVNQRGIGGASLLAMAAKAGYLELVKSLLAAGADKEATDTTSRTPLMYAAQSRHADVVSAMLSAGASVTALDLAGNNALCWAAGLGDAASVQALLDAKSEVNIVNKVTGWTPLIWAAGFGDPNSIPLLVKAHASVEAIDRLQGATPLIHAVRNGKVEHVRELIKAGAKMDARDFQGKTAFLAAAESTSAAAEKVKALIDAGADIHAKDKMQRNALTLARLRNDSLAPSIVAVFDPLLAAETPKVQPPPVTVTPTGPTDKK